MTTRVLVLPSGKVQGSGILTLSGQVKNSAANSLSFYLGIAAVVGGTEVNRVSSAYTLPSGGVQGVTIVLPLNVASFPVVGSLLARSFLNLNGLETTIFISGALAQVQDQEGLPPPLYLSGDPIWMGVVAAYQYGTIDTKAPSYYLDTGGYTGWHYQILRGGSTLFINEIGGFDFPENRIFQKATSRPRYPFGTTVKWANGYVDPLDGTVYPDQYGVISNVAYDPTLGYVYSIDAIISGTKITISRYEAQILG